ncbi:CACTA en-spm transposon protein [Cucumis melo var. makuwa]|uniref:CACTA en-spm transposon protein n=1 Tax=Cucumis melo var. makuwa TaxID=1194695 RepID=A0A5A7UHM4_CUCMM|nr:CACTA en-spm transposon protein [Cucumis melo var. makuwa]
MDAMFLEFIDDLDNLAGGSLSVGKCLARLSSQPFAISTSRRRTKSRLLELECYIAANKRILMMIVLSTKNPISPYTVCFSQVIGSLSIRCSVPLKCFEVTVTPNSKSTATQSRLVPTHHNYWWDVMRIGISSVTTT